MNSYQCISGIHFVCCHGEIKWRPRTFTQVLATKAGDLRLSRLDQKKRGRYGHVNPYWVHLRSIRRLWCGTLSGCRLVPPSSMHLMVLCTLFTELYHQTVLWEAVRVKVPPNNRHRLWRDKVGNIACLPVMLGQIWLKKIELKQLRSITRPYPPNRYLLSCYPTFANG